MRKILLVNIILLIGYSSYSQKLGSRERAIQLIGYITDSAVLLRWAPTNHISWQMGNRYGYSVYRKTVIRDGKVIENPDSILLGNYKPIPIEAWEPYSDSSIFAVAAEAIYGSGMELSVSTPNNFFDIVDVAKDQENRFSLGLLCADRSFTTACLMGIGAVDSSIKRNEAYVYVVRSSYTDTSGVNEVGSTFIDFSMGNFLPRPFQVKVDKGTSEVTFLIPYDPFRGIYTTFEIQRSDKGGSFKTITGNSYFSLSTNKNDSGYFTFKDTIPNAEANYCYRIRGVTPFETFGPFSDTIYISVRPKLISKPTITSVNEIDGKVSLTWEYDSSRTSNAKGFVIYGSSQIQKDYKPVLVDTIDTKQRFALLPLPSDFIYFRVGVIDKYNRSYMSEPVLFQTVDSVPPTAPTGLNGNFDSTGMLTLTWKKNHEPDLLGYNVLYAASSSKEFSQLNRELVYDTLFTYSFPLNMLSGKLLFKVIASDTRHNLSEASESICLIKPDTIPPSPPVIELVKDSIGDSFIKIYPSKGHDIKKHVLYFKNGAGITELFTFYSQNDTVFKIDSLSSNGSFYCIVYDQNNTNARSNTVDINNLGGIAENNFIVSYRLNIDKAYAEFFWENYKNCAVYVYRKEDGEQYKLISTIPPGMGYFKDTKLKLFNNYNYKFIATGKDCSYKFYLYVMFK